MTNAALFYIEDFHHEPDSIMVDLVKNDTFRRIKVPRELYEQWLRYDDRLNTEMNYSDESGRHQQELGLMSLEEYWDQTRNPIEKDLHDFIVTKMVNHRLLLTRTLNDIKENCNPLV